MNAVTKEQDLKPKSTDGTKTEYTTSVPLEVPVMATVKPVPADVRKSDVMTETTQTANMEDNERPLATEGANVVGLNQRPGHQVPKDTAKAGTKNLAVLKIPSSTHQSDNYVPIVTPNTAARALELGLVMDTTAKFSSPIHNVTPQPHANQSRPLNQLGLESSTTTRKTIIPSNVPTPPTSDTSTGVPSTPSVAPVAAALPNQRPSLPVEAETSAAEKQFLSVCSDADSGIAQYFLAKAKGKVDVAIELYFRKQKTATEVSSNHAPAVHVSASGNPNVDTSTSTTTSTKAKNTSRRTAPARATATKVLGVRVSICIGRMLNDYDDGKFIP